MKVYIESPFRHEDPEVQFLYIKYAGACAKSCIDAGENPFISHLLFTQFLDDNDPDDRILGMNLGFEWAKLCDKTIIFGDMGVSEGMIKGIAIAREEKRMIEFRTLPEEHRQILMEENPGIEELFNN